MQTHSWWPRQLAIGWLNLVLSAPLIYLFVGLPLVMRQHGWSGTQIGLMQVTGLSALLKFLLAAPIDRWRLGRASYRNWSVLLAMGYVGALLLIATHDLADTPFPLIFALAVLVSLLGTFTDMPVNALAIRILPESERLRAGSIRATATSLAAVVGGGLMLMLHVRMGWTWPLCVLALGVLSSVPTVWWLAKSEEAVSPGMAETLPRAEFQHWVDWFRMPRHWHWTAVLLLYFPLIGAGWVFLKPLMLDHGMAPDRIARVIGVGGGLMGALGSLAGGHVSRKYGTRVTLPLFAALGLLALGVMFAANWLGWDTDALAAAALLLAVAMGAAGGLVFGLMMYHVRPGLSALDYGTQSSLFVTGRTLLPVLAGCLLDRLGYAGMFVCLWVGLAILLGCLLVPRRGPPEFQKPSLA